MPEPRPETIADAIVTTLAGIVGDGGANFWFTPGAVVRAHVLTADMLNPAIDPFYVVTPDRKEESRRSSQGPGGIIRGRAFLTLSLLKRHAVVSEQPMTATTPTRWTLEERMQRDVRKALRLDPHLGGVSSGLDVVDSEDGNQDTELTGWALTFLRLIVTYHYAHETP